MRNATIRDVAKMAGVSVSTVSRVINGNYPVSKESARRVQSAVKELDFTPHIMASNLKSGKSRTVGMIISNIVNPTIMLQAKGVETVLEKHNYLLSISSTDNDPGKEERLLRFFQERRVDAAIVITATMDAGMFEPLRRHNIPLVLLDRDIPGSDFDAVIQDNYEASYAMTRRIMMKGHRRIMIVKGKNISNGIDRFQGAYDAMRDSGVAIDPDLFLEANFNRDLAKKLVLDYFAGHPQRKHPSVIFAFSSPMTQGVLEAVYETGMKVPDDISIVSYDIVSNSALFRPSIACVCQDSLYMGKQAAKLALQRLEERSGGDAGKGVKIVIKSALIDGESLGTVKA